MTVNFEVPVIEYTGNNSTTVFTFDWSSGDANDIYVQIDGVDATEGVEYELENYDGATGGEIVFEVPPAIGVLIRIYRQTPITQQISYEEGEPFQAETHEAGMDKDTRILQEINVGVGSEFGDGIDLYANQQPATVIIENTGGSDATIVPWTTDGATAGVFMGEVIQDTGTSPIVDDPTDEPEGYVWFKLGVPNWVGGDPTIVSRITQLRVESAEASPRAEMAWTGVSGNVGWGYDQNNPSHPPIFQVQEAVRPINFGAGEYWVKMEQVTGTFQGDTVDTWLDAATAYSWFTDGTSEVAGIFTIAPDDGGGSPDMNFAISRQVVLVTEVI